ncbi:MAG: DUF4260 domain-containing protein [Vicinamibacterales bacterium]
MYVAGAPRTWLRLEGLAVLLASLVAYHWQLGSWTLFGALFLVPDVSMLGYLRGPALGARLYNLAHSYAGPIFLMMYGVAVGRSDVVPWALIWSAHAGFDRMMGFGLKYPDHFEDTHLGRIGRRKQAA